MSKKIEKLIDECMTIIANNRELTLAECAKKNAKSNQQSAAYARLTRDFVAKVCALDYLDAREVFSRLFDSEKSRALAVYAHEKLNDTLAMLVYSDKSQVSSLHFAYLSSMIERTQCDNKTMHADIMRKTFKSHSTADTQCSSSMKALSVLNVVKYDDKSRVQTLIENDTSAKLREIVTQ